MKEEGFIMKQKSTMLKVISILLIIFGGLSLISGIYSIVMRGVIEKTAASLGIAIPSTLSYVLTLVGAFVFLAAGIIGTLYKSKQSVLILGIILAVFEVFNIVYATMTAGFAPLNLIALIWPLLYLRGWYQSN